MRTEQELQKEFNRIEQLPIFSQKLMSELRIIQAEFKNTYNSNYPNARVAYKTIADDLAKIDKDISLDILENLYEKIQINSNLARKDDGYFSKVKYAFALQALYNASYPRFQVLITQQQLSQGFDKIVGAAIEQKTLEVTGTYEAEIAKLHDELNTTKQKLNETQQDLEQSRLNTSLNTSQLDILNNSYYLTQSFMTTINKPQSTDKVKEDKTKLFKHTFNGNVEKFRLIQALQKLTGGDINSNVVDSLIFNLLADPNNDDKYSQIKQHLSQGISTEMLQECLDFSGKVNASTPKPSQKQLQATGQAYKTGYFLTKNNKHVTYFITEYKNAKSALNQQQASVPSLN
jgi:hypothetical protein